MKKNFKLASLAFGAMMAGVLAGCTAESGYLNIPDAPEASPLVSLAKGTDVRAMSNGFIIPSTAVSSEIWEISLNDNYEYNFPEAEFEKVRNMSVPSNATNLTSSSNDQNGTYLIPAGETVTTMVPNNFGGTLYIAGTYKPSQLGNNSNNIVIYILPGGELEYSSINNNNGTIYNAGKLTLTGGFDGIKIKDIYNIGSIEFTNQWSNSLDYPDAMSIYSEGGYILFNSAQVDIKGKIISSNIVEVTGNVKFQNSKDRDICWLKAENGLVDITDNTNVFGTITAKNLKFDGAKIKLHPEGLIDIENEIIVHNSGCGILAHDANAKGLVVTPKFTSENDPLSRIFDPTIYLNTQAISEKEGGIQYDDKLNSSTINDRVNKIDIESLQNCGKPGNYNDPSEKTDPDPDPDPETPETPDTPDTPDVAPTPDHVEVNLEVEEHADYLATHLSIHVRAVTDVEVFIPVKAELYVDTDDMEIVQKHETDLMVHGGPEVLTYNIDGNIVTLTVSFEEGGIRVTTQGINEEVINYLKENTGDGLTFEVWNYYNPEAFAGEGASIEEAQKALRDYLEDNIATVEFTDEPDLYVNAFFFDNTYDEDGVWNGYNKDVINPWDCTVRIVDSQKDDYEDPEAGVWFNTSQFNQLQDKK